MAGAESLSNRVLPSAAPPNPKTPETTMHRTVISARLFLVRVTGGEGFLGTRLCFWTGLNPLALSHEPDVPALLYPLSAKLSASKLLLNPEFLKLSRGSVCMLLSVC